MDITRISWVSGSDMIYMFEFYVSLLEGNLQNGTPAIICGL